MFLEEYWNNVWSCGHCNRCKYIADWSVKSVNFSSICPSLSKYLFDSYSAQGRLELTRAIIKREIELTPKTLEIIFTCTLGGGCQIACQRSLSEIKPLEVLRALRREVISKGLILPKHKAILNSLEVNNNPYSKQNEYKREWAKGLKIKNALKHKTKYLYFVGCTAARFPILHSIPQSMVKIFNALGLSFSVLLDQEPCCGSVCNNIGASSITESIMESNRKLFKKIDPDIIITTCAGCYDTLTYLKDFNVMHITELLAEKMPPLKKEGVIDLPKVTFHDPCHLGRLHGIYDEPRAILESIPGLQFVEMERIKEHSWCCGAGGGVRAAFPDLAEFSAQERVAEARSVGAEALVTSCSFCSYNLNQSTDMKIFDIPQLLGLLL
ncbi:MAG: (Fe-S)-binding protein [Promethearchaeia archaeon]